MIHRSAFISVVSENEISREGLRRILVEGRFEAACYDQKAFEAVVTNLDEARDHIIIIENENAAVAIAASELVRKHQKNARLVLLGDGYDLVTVREAMASGVDACLSRQTPCVPLMLMLDLVALGERVLPRNVVDECAVLLGPAVDRTKRQVFAGPSQDLSQREMSILRCLVDGDPNKIIARKLGIADATVKIHIKGILRKLQVRNRTQAAIWVVDQGLFDRTDTHDTQSSDGFSAEAHVCAATSEAGWSHSTEAVRLNA